MQNSENEVKRISQKIRFLMAVLKSGSNIFLILFCYSFFASYFLTAELLTHFQVFYLGCAIFGFVLALYLKKQIYLAIHAITIVFILFKLLPFYFYQDTIRNKEEILTVYQANVLVSNTNYQLVLDQITNLNPDLILLIETDSRWGAATTSLNEKYPYQIKSLDKGPFGFIFFSKIPLSNSEKINFGTGFDCLNIIVNWQGSNIRFIGAHPPPPMNDEYFKVRNLHISKYSEMINSQKVMPTIICGDLNITPWSPSYQELIKKAGLHSTRYGFGILATWPSNLPYRIPIDHCLMTNHFGVENTKVLPSINSDHLPMLNKIFLKTKEN